MTRRYHRALLLRHRCRVHSPGSPRQAGQPKFAVAFETWLLHELIAFRDYVSGETVHHWRSSSGFEVDFILGDHSAIEVKAKEIVSARDLRSLHALAEEQKLKR